MKTNNKSQVHMPVPILIGEGRLILDAGIAHPEVADRLDKDYLKTTETVLGNVKTQATGQKQQRGKTAVLTMEQLDKIADFQHWKTQARKTAKLAFKGQTVKLHEQFQVGVHKPHDLQSQLQRGRVILAACQAQENAGPLASKGWTADETTALDNSIKAIEGDKTLLEAAKDAGVGLTGTRNVSVDDLYERLLTIQHAATLEWRDNDPASAQTLADFRLGKFPPRNHPQPDEPAPAPTPAPQAK